VRRSIYRQSSRWHDATRDRNLGRKPKSDASSIRRLDHASDLAFRGRFDEALSFARGAASTPDGAWLIAYVDTARGRFARAEIVLEELIASAESSRSTRARAAATLGSVLRQTDRHPAARDIERAALRAAPTPELRAHLRIGLVADAVGMGDLRAVDAALKKVGARPAGGWRTSVRLRWVRCERELLAGRPAPAVAHARKALSASVRAEARRHEAKSLLFLGASLIEVLTKTPAPADADRLEREAGRALQHARNLALEIGAEPIAVVAGGLSSDRMRRG
jgi:tetratricopeptide (TPR) repeat protein